VLHFEMQVLCIALGTQPASTIVNLILKSMVSLGSQVPICMGETPMRSLESPELIVSGPDT